MSKQSKQHRGRKVLGAREDENHVITHVLIEGNTRYTPKADAIRMVDKGEIEGLHVVREKDGTTYLRSNPDDTKKNNLDTLARD